MKKQVTLNLDALVVVSIVFLLALVFIGYQRYQYSDLLEEHMQLQWEAQDIDYLKTQLAQCSKPE